MRLSRCRVSTSSSGTWCRSCRLPCLRCRRSLSWVSFPSEVSNMEKMPYRQEMDVHFPKPSIDPVISTITTDWRQGLPVLAGMQVTLREMRASDAVSLHALLTTEEVSRFISPPPTTVDGFEKFIAWTV